MISKTPEKCVRGCDGAERCIAASGDGKAARCLTSAGHSSPEGAVPQGGDRDAASAREAAGAELELGENS